MQTTLEWANWYFDLAHQALGNTFEISTLETCQALFLLNALKPHSSYLYSGMSIRTAIAIGLTNETYGNSIRLNQEARRTWWCIYSHEVSPNFNEKKQSNLCHPESNKSQFAIISVMVDLARILQAASQDIYHDMSKQPLQKKSQISFQLDKSLDIWEKKLPDFLDLQSFALDDAEWAFKQKLVLKFLLLDFPNVPGEELIRDVEKSLEIFSVLGKHVTVAKRSGELTQEILGVAKTYLRGPRNRQMTSSHIATPSIPSNIGADLFGSTFANGGEMWNNEHLIALLNEDEPGMSRVDVLANFLDPNILENFVTGDDYF
ncbi:hypothetical protein G7Z17_g602 [Cylindrodendrum hubeiense]|uniref:Xylanolytic transcriptional activator regulatory domain-containing protein n=1 Tax=Cylindrodendrum hubeiense TaxID=595255 RepID=A0A9P5HKW7_9HYPO|nr:hypothetical protein G7Z17_g602 [Cylindrodendrum hubeiense]